MRRRLLSGAALCLLALAQPLRLHAEDAPAQAVPATAAQQLRDLFADDARREGQLHPLENLGDRNADPRQLARLFTDALEARQLASARQSLAVLARIDRATLGPEQQLSYDTFAAAKGDAATLHSPPLHDLMAVQPFNHFLGLPMTFPAQMAHDGGLRWANAGDYRRALQADIAFCQALDNAIARFRIGMARGVVEPRLTVRDMIAQIDGLLALGVEGSPFYSPIKHLPRQLNRTQRQQLRRAYAATIAGQINPAYRRLRAFLAVQYLPAARDSIGLAALPGGDQFYRTLIRVQTTLPLEPEAVHQLGLDEVARIEQAMAGVKAELGFAGPLPAFFDELRRNPAYHPRCEAELAAGYAAIARQVDARIPAFFERAPREPLLIRPYPAYRGKFEAGGGYEPAGGDGAPGVFHYNTFDLANRFLTGMTTLYLHEGAPGHHFQIALAQENTALPDFQRQGGNTAFVEGWALYAETLGYPMGLYADPRQHWGTLDDEMLRAMRLVVDTGIHARGWSREQAIAYMLAHSGMGRSDVEAEVDRYIANPAQALAYKVGALTIQRLRARAEATLGPRFDIRRFHSVVLGSGALPLPVLEAKIARWIAEQLQPGG
jgi:uncharacterized protein (DUF885 family)